MRLKRCKSCGKDFSTDKEGAYLCPECAQKSRQESVYRERVCTICGSPFMGYPRSLYCPSCRETVRRERDRKHKASKPARPIGSIDTCKICGAEYTVESGNQKYCKDCAESAILEKSRQRKREYNRENAKMQQEHKDKMRTQGKVCVICGRAFDGRGASVTCSDTCARKHLFNKRAIADLKRGKRKSPPR